MVSDFGSHVVCYIITNVSEEPATSTYMVDDVSHPRKPKSQGHNVSVLKMD
jgi:hypothetical protein